MVEIEPSENVEPGSPCLSRSSKSFKKNPVFSMERKQQRKNVRVLEVIEDTSPMPSMLSPQESAGRSGVVLFPSQKDSYVSPRIGIAVAARDSEIYSPGISLLELEKKVTSFSLNDLLKADGLNLLYCALFSKPFLTHFCTKDFPPSYLAKSSFSLVG